MSSCSKICSALYLVGENPFSWHLSRNVDSLSMVFLSLPYVEIPCRILDTMSALKTVSISLSVLCLSLRSRMMYRRERREASSFFLCKRKLQFSWKVIPKMLTDLTVSKSDEITQEQLKHLLIQKRMCFVLSELILKLFCVDHFCRCVISSCKNKNILCFVFQGQGGYFHYSIYEYFVCLLREC